MPKPHRHRAPLDERGATLVEYILLVGCVALLALVGFRVFGGAVETTAARHAACVSELEGCSSGSAGTDPSGVADASTSSRDNGHHGIAYWTGGIVRGFGLELWWNAKQLGTLVAAATPVGQAYYAMTGKPNPLAEAGLGLIKLALSASPPGQLVAAFGGPDPLGDTVRGLVKLTSDSWKRDKAETVGRIAAEAALLYAPSKVAEVAELGSARLAMRAAVDGVPSDAARLARAGEELAEAAGDASKLTGLGERADAIAARSPRLTSAIADLKNDGWTFRFQDGDATYCNAADKEIVISSRYENLRPEQLEDALAHEVGHARYAQEFPDEIVHSADEFKAQHVERVLDHEGEANLFSVEVALDSGRDLDFVKGVSPEGWDAVQDYMDGKISRQDARRIIGEGSREARPSGTAKGTTYESNARDQLADFTDESMKLDEDLFSGKLTEDEYAKRVDELRRKHGKP